MSFTVEIERGRGGEVVIVSDVPTLGKALEIVSAELDRGPHRRGVILVWYGKDRDLILSVHEDNGEWVLKSLAEKMP